MKFSRITNVRWTDEDKKQIICDVFFDDLGQTHTYNASPTDPVEHGRKIFEEARKLVTANTPVFAREAPVRRFSKKKLFESMTDAEYDTWEQIERQQNKRKARMFREASELNDSDPAFKELLGVMTQAFGSARTVALLATAAI